MGGEAHMSAGKRIVWCWIAAFALPTLATPTVALCAGITTNFIGLRLVDSGSDDTPDDSAALAASEGVRSARDQVHRMDIQLARRFEETADYQLARLDAAQAYWAYALRKEQALATLHLSPEYAAGRIAIERLEQQLDDAREQARLAGKDHGEQIDAFAHELLTRRSALSQQEAKFVAADRAFNQLRYAWLDSNAKLVAMEEDFAQRLRVDPQWQSAKSQLEQARTALASISR
jgi:hypothetical protein